MVMLRFNAEAGLTPANARQGFATGTAERRGLMGEPRVPTCSNICRCTGYANIVEAVVAAGGKA